MTDKSFTVLTVSKRDGWFELACESIARQTLKPDKWIIVPEGSFSNYATDPPCPTEFWPAPMQLRASNLNASLNEGLRHVDTEYVVFYQDFIDLPQRCFKMLMALVNDSTFVTTCTPNYDGSDDIRFTGVKKPRRCRPEEWEANVAAAPMSIIKQLGGYDEEYDNGWSWDNRNLAERAQMLGVDFILDESNRPKLLPHEMVSREGLELNAERHDRTMREIREGKRPLKCKYL